MGGDSRSSPKPERDNMRPSQIAAVIERGNHLDALASALDASPRALRQDACGDWQISGKQGHIYADRDGWLIVVTTDESPRRWTNVKQRLSPFCRITQDGDDDGCLHLDHLPKPRAASVIREAIGIKRKRQLSAEAKASLANRFSQNSTGRPSNVRPFVSGPKGYGDARKRHTPSESV
jgi:hypothetical protein